MNFKKEAAKEEAKADAKKEVVRDSISSRADSVSPPLEGTDPGAGQVQEFYALGEGSEPVIPTVQEVTDAVNAEAGK